MGFWRDGNRLIWEGSGELLCIEPFGKDCLRCRSTAAGRIEEEDWTLLPQPPVEAEVVIEGQRATISTGRIVAEVQADGRVRYLVRDSGEVLLEELWIDRRTSNANLIKARNYRHVGGEMYRVSVYFQARDDERFYGMGQYLNDRLNLKGCVLELAQKNTQISIPFLVSSRGYGFLWNNPSIGRAELVYNHTMWHAEATKQVDYLVLYGGTPAEVVRRYMELTGKPPMLPEWALGFWQSKLRYRTQEELLRVVREYKERDLPLSVVVIDYFHWPKQGDWRFDPQYWPDPKAMVEELARMGVRVMVSIWPTVDVTSENYPEMVARRMLVKTERGVPVTATFRGTCTYFDATNAEARTYVWEKVKNNYYRYGIKAFWLDEAEPELMIRGFGYDNVSAYDYDNIRYARGNGLAVSNLYPFYYAKTFWDGMRAEGEEDIVNLIRSAWIGSQRFGVVVWSGDVPSTFDSLRRHVKAGLNMAMAGIPWWTTDVGGFYDGDPEDPTFRELVVRWFQYGVFCPILRLHGFRLPYPKDYLRSDMLELTGGPNEVWSFGDEAYRILRDYLQVRERMRPYLLQQMKRAHEDGVPVMRPLFFDFPGDETTYQVEDEYMLGPDLLVAPVVRERAVTRKVYLPGGASWTDPHAGRRYEGGQWVECEAPLHLIPVFLRDGADVPVTPTR